MECKCCFFPTGVVGFFIKVEPYWNVNQNSNITETVDEGIKVEPYWNVNGVIWVRYSISSLD